MHELAMTCAQALLTGKWLSYAHVGGPQSTIDDQEA
jgi:hypothetical protein